MTSGQPLRPVGENLIGALALAPGDVLTLCYRGGASAQPTQTHTQLGSLGEQEKKLSDNRKIHRPWAPPQMWGSQKPLAPLRQGVLTHGAGLPFRSGVFGTLSGPCTRVSWGFMYTQDAGPSHFSGLLSISPLPDGGLSMGRMSKAGPKNQKHTISCGDGQCLPPDLTHPDSGTKDVPGHEA